MNEQIENGIFLDVRYSMEGNIPGGIKRQQLEDVASSAPVQQIQREMQELFAKREDKDHSFSVDLGVINSPYDAGLRQAVKETLDDIAAKGIEVRHVVLAGIGGSELGATAVITPCGRRTVSYHPITSLNNDNIARILDAIDPEKTVLIEVSRSGTTKETLTAYSVVKKYLEASLGQRHKDHCVAVLGKDKQEVAKEAASHYKIGIEPAMSGRFSGLHAANLFTMALMGVDVDAVHSGARYMLEKCMTARDTNQNPALQIAALKYIMNTQNGKMVWNTGVFSPDLVKYGDWLDQLTEESIGHNDKVRLSTKTTELSNKLHSDFQNWCYGDNIFYHHFVFPLQSEKPVIGNPTQRGETLEDIELAAYMGVAKSLAERGRPSYTTFMASANPVAMGQLMMRDILTTIYLGELLGLGTEPGIKGKGYFNQPGVEDYKKVMKGLLTDPSQLKAEYEKIVAIRGAR